MASGAIQSLTVSLARSVDVLIRLSVGVSGEAMQVVEIIEPRVPGGDEIVHLPIFEAEKNADGVTRFVPTGEVPRLVDQLETMGITVDRSIFSATPDSGKGG